jgi:C-terminal processing protease CtpA/Prc
VKKYISPALILVLCLSVGLPVFTGAQDRRPQEPSGGARLGNPAPGVSAPARRNSRSRNSSEAMADIEQGVSEALAVIEDNYVDGKKLDYNNVFKSSIIGMLRTLDPHSNYYDKEEFDELKTDQRSEYYGIGASIQNQTIGSQTDTYITATLPPSTVSICGASSRQKYATRFEDPAVRRFE